VNLSFQHLSDEAVAAFADGYLGAVARTRAARHLAECAECANSVAGQREAARALRSAAAPAPPTGLLDRLRAVPATTPLTPGHGTPAPDGSTVFRAFGTVLVAGFVDPSATKVPGAAVGSAARIHPPKGLLPIFSPVRQRTHHLALAIATVALVGLTASAAGAAATHPSTHPSTGRSNTHDGNDVAPAIFTAPSPPGGPGDDSTLLPTGLMPADVTPSHR
jgi:anti-sigma factor RsiW